MPTRYSYKTGIYLTVTYKCPFFSKTVLLDTLKVFCLPHLLPKQKTMWLVLYIITVLKSPITIFKRLSQSVAVEVKHEKIVKT